MVSRTRTERSYPTRTALDDWYQRLVVVNYAPSVLIVTFRSMSNHTKHTDNSQASLLFTVQHPPPPYCLAANLPNTDPSIHAPI